MKHGHDLGFLLVTAMLLLLCLMRLNGCDTGKPETVGSSTPPMRVSAEPGGGADERAASVERKAKSVQEFAAEEGQEEREKLQNISRALKTMAADPQIQKTYGLPP